MARTPRMARMPRWLADYPDPTTGSHTKPTAAHYTQPVENYSY